MSRVENRFRHEWRVARGFTLDANVRSALKALHTNGMRSLLTMLGVIIGVAAVIASVSLTQGATASINERLLALGTNVLTILPGPGAVKGAIGAVGTSQSLTLSDTTAIAQMNHVYAISPVLSTQGQVIYNDKNWNTSINGVYKDFQSIQNWQMSEGSWFSNSDEASAKSVAVIGQTVATNLFAQSGADPLGQTIRLNNQLFQIVGVLQARGGQIDDVVYVPFSSAQSRLKNAAYIDAMQIQVDSLNNVGQLRDDVTTLLRKRHHIQQESDDFSVLSSNQLVQTAKQNTSILTALLIGIAAISLTVGGIGIMNIMLVSVTERTREIGIRMAIGARQSDIRNQFLIEALILSAVGGILGILLGILGGFSLAQWLSSAVAGDLVRMSYVLDPVSVALAFGVSALTGILFGLYPALRAAQLDPIVALRTE